MSFEVTIHYQWRILQSALQDYHQVFAKLNKGVAKKKAD